MIPLHQNECYWLLDEELVSLIRGSMDNRTFSTYPDYVELNTALAAYAGVSENTLTLSAGSDASISLIAEMCVKRGLRAVLPVPTFYGYERILARHNANVIPTYYSESGGKFIFPLEETLAAIEKNSALFLCHPNNPLGCTIPEETIAQLLDATKKKNVLVVLDEAYFEFGGTTQNQRINEQPLIIIRTLSKAFGLSGARIGYTISASDLQREMKALQLPWPIAHASVRAARALLTVAEHVKERRQAVMTARDAFVSDLSVLDGIRAYPSVTNFVLIRTSFSEQIASMLRQKGVQVAQTDFMSAFEPAKKILANTLRLSVPSPEDRELVLGVIGEVTLRKQPVVV